MGKRWAKGNYCDLIPDKLFGVYLGDCCYNHDVNYWKKPITRKLADLRLKRCIFFKFCEQAKRKLGWFISDAIYIFLRIFGWIRWSGLDEKIISFFKIKSKEVNMAKKIKLVGPLKLDKEGAKKIGRSFVLTVASAAVATLGQLFGVIDFGSYSNLAVIAVPFILNTLNKWLGTYKSK